MNLDVRRCNLGILISLVGYGTIKRLRRSKSRKKWVKTWLLRKDLHHMNLLKVLQEDDPDDFKNYLRMDENTFNYLLSLVKVHLTKQDTVMRKAIPPEERVIATLRYLASGRYFNCLRFSVGISEQALGYIIPETCRVLYEVLRKEFMKIQLKNLVMLNILQLPQEILCLICEHLGTKDKHCLYDTCTIFRNVVTSRALNKKIVLSLSTLATSESLKLAYIKNVSEYIEELDMSGVCDLTKTSLIPSLNRMKNLKTLNVAYTNITIPDLTDGKLRTNIKKLTINFNFSKKDSDIVIPITTLKAAQSFFENIENVHFVGLIENMLYSRLPVYILKKCKKDILVKFTVLRNFYGTVYANVDDIDTIGDLTFKYLSISFPVLTDTEDSICDRTVSNFTNFKLFTLQNFEYILILNSSANLMYCSEAFKSFLSKHFNIVTNCISQLPFLEFKYNSLFWFWDKNSTTFDEVFFNNLFIRVKDFFPNYIRYFEYNQPVLIRNNHSDWFNIKPLVLKTYRTVPTPTPPKKQRLGLDSFLLDFDDLLQSDDKLKLKFNFGPTVLNFTLNREMNYLKKVTVISLVGNYLYSPDFFSVLFEKCTNLVTLNIGYSPKCFPSKSISKSIHLSHSIKNVRIIDCTIDFASLFAALSKIKTLESLYIADHSYVNKYPFPTSDIEPLITQCDNLYSLFIHLVMADSLKLKILRFISNLKQTLNRSYLFVDINNDKEDSFHTEGLDPFLMFLR